MAITAEQKYLLNKMNSISNKVQLGTLIEEAGAVTATEIALANGKVLIGDATGKAAAQTLSGDVTMTAAGVTAVGNGKVTKDMLATGVKPAGMIVHQSWTGLVDTGAGPHVVDIADAGFLATDIGFAQIKQVGAVPVSILGVVMTDGHMTVTLSGNPAGDHSMQYMVVRATS